MLRSLAACMRMRHGHVSTHAGHTLLSSTRCQARACVRAFVECACAVDCARACARPYLCVCACVCVWMCVYSQNVKDADKEIIKRLKDDKRLVSSGTIVHR